MPEPLFQRIADGFGGGLAPDLRVRIFRLISALTAGLCLLVVAPLNLLQNLPWGLHAANVTLGLAGAVCYWQSCRGRHYISSFFVALLLLLDFAWFCNAGSAGSVTHYYYPVMLFVIAMFQGRSRWLVAVVLWLNVGLLFVLEHIFPAWVTPFLTEQDRLMDLETGVFCSFVALASVTRFILGNYNREHQRVSEIAARLAASEANYREIFNSTSDALFVHAADGHLLDVNEQGCTLFGADRATLLRANVNDFSLDESPYSQKEALVYVGLAMRGQAQTFEWRSKRANGELFWSEVALRKWELGTERGVIASVRDITQRRQDQESLRLSEERMRLAIGASDQSWFDANLQTGTALTSPEYSRILGYPSGELQTSLEMWRERVHPEDRPELNRLFQQALQTREITTMEYRLRTKSGAWKWMRSVGQLVECDAAGRPLRMLGTHMDISVRKQVEAALALNEERLRLAMEASSQGWFELNVRTGETQSSVEYVRMLEYEPGEFNSDLRAWMSRIHPEDREATMQAYQQSLQTGNVGTMEYRQKAKSGKWKWFRSVAKVVEKDAEGRPLRAMGTHTDITERKDLEAQLLHSQRLEVVGTLAGGVAHDLNNILTPMLMASGILRGKLTEAKDRELMAMLDDGGRRGAAIVKQLLAFSRNLTQNRVPVDLGQLLGEVGQLLRATLPKEITMAVNASAGQGRVEADPNQLHQVLMNLCVNARDAMPSGGTMTLGLRRLDKLTAPGAKDGPYLELSVADTGEGIAPEIMDQIFDPFFTTKPVGKGTGLGLASVHGIIKSHHGFVRVESQPGQGAIFRVYLPALKDWGIEAPLVTAPSPEPEAVPPPPAKAPVGTGILVVDDDPAVLLVTSRLLTRMGHTVIQAESGAVALQLLPQHHAAITIAITDFAMPGMDGPTLAPHLRALSPALRIIGVSGQNQDHRMEELTALGFHEVLNKPYELDDLMHAVRRQLAYIAHPA